MSRSQLTHPHLPCSPIPRPIASHRIPPHRTVLCPVIAAAAREGDPLRCGSKVRMAGTWRRQEARGDLAAQSYARHAQDLRVQARQRARARHAVKSTVVSDEQQSVMLSDDQ